MRFLIRNPHHSHPRPRPGMTCFRTHPQYADPHHSHPSPARGPLVSNHPSVISSLTRNLSPPSSATQAFHPPNLASLQSSRIKCRFSLPDASFPPPNLASLQSSRIKCRFSLPDASFSPQHLASLQSSRIKYRFSLPDASFSPPNPASLHRRSLATIASHKAQSSLQIPAAAHNSALAQSSQREPFGFRSRRLL